MAVSHVLCILWKCKRKKYRSVGDGSEDFLELIKEKEILASVFYTDEKMWYVSDLLPERSLKMEGKEDGVEVSINRLSGIRAEKYNIFFVCDQILLEPRERMQPVEEFMECMAEITGRKNFCGKGRRSPVLYGTASGTGTVLYLYEKKL